jgi:ornithine carbamoyltransferase
VKHKHLLTLDDYSRADIEELFKVATELKINLQQGKDIDTLRKKTLAMIFEKPSARTRTSFEVGMVHLGGHSIFVQQAEIGMNNRESISDLAKNYSRFVDGVVIRAKKHSDIVEFSENSSIPVINGLSDSHHPCQGLADVFTILEKKKSLDLKVAYIGDYNNVSRSLANVCHKMGIELVISSPKKYLDFDSEGLSLGREEDPIAAVKDADVIYTDVWASMGQEDELEKRKKEFSEYAVNDKLIQSAKKDVLFMHCLPARRGEEVTDSVMDGSHSVVFDQAENRMHVQKAVLVKLMGN